MLDALNGGVDPLAGRIRDPVKNVIEDAFGVVPGHVRDFFQRLQPASKDRLHPLTGEPARPAPLPATPEVIEVFSSAATRCRSADPAPAAPGISVRF